MCICQAKRHNFKLPQTLPRGNAVFSLSDCSISISLGRKRNLIFGTSAVRCRCGEEGMNLPWWWLSISDNPHKIGFFTNATAETQGLHKRSIYDTVLSFPRPSLQFPVHPKLFESCENTSWNSVKTSFSSVYYVHATSLGASAILNSSPVLPA